MNKDWTPEPWVVKGAKITRKNMFDHNIAFMSDAAPRGRNGTQKLIDVEVDANAQRIVSCVNSCRHIKDPEKAIPAMVKALRKALHMIDCLMGDTDPSDPDDEYLIGCQNIVKALSLVEGES